MSVEGTPEVVEVESDVHLFAWSRLPGVACCDGALPHHCNRHHRPGGGRASERRLRLVARRVASQTWLAITVLVLTCGGVGGQGLELSAGSECVDHDSCQPGLFCKKLAHNCTRLGFPYTCGICAMCYECGCHSDSVNEVCPRNRCPGPSQLISPIKELSSPSLPQLLHSSAGNRIPIVHESSDDRRIAGIECAENISFCAGNLPCTRISGGGR